MARAVLFDLWQTLATWPEETSRKLRRLWAETVGVEPERVEARWLDPAFSARREAGPIADALAALYREFSVQADPAELLARRLELTREALVPVDGALDTLRELKRRGLRTGLVSNCTEEVALAWESAPFAPYVDVAVFSATAGCLKPEPRIYELALERLGLPAQDCLFVGDGANDELEGAERVGLTAVLVEGAGAPRDWRGLRIRALPELLELVR